MKLTQVKGSTWVLEANELIPLYLLDDRRCVLLDSGLAKEREEIEKTLLEAGLEPAGILCSHAHVDHCANNRYFQEKYHLPVALTAPEAGMCSSILNLKCYRLLVSPDAAEQEMSEMVHVPDLILPPVDGPIRLAGAMFRILHTPGHSSGHICAVTPDNVCYTGDALMSQALLDAKLPYGLSIQLAMESRERLRVLAKTADGFRIAEEDLKLRGPGDFFGQRQHGLPTLKAADLSCDVQLLDEAQSAARALLTQDPQLAAPAHAPLLRRIRRLFAASEGGLN